MRMNFYAGKKLSTDRALTFSRCRRRRCVIADIKTAHTIRKKTIFSKPITTPTPRMKLKQKKKIICFIWIFFFGSPAGDGRRRDFRGRCELNLQWKKFFPIFLRCSCGGLTWKYRNNVSKSIDCALSIHKNGEMNFRPVTQKCHLFYFKKFATKKNTTQQLEKCSSRSAAI